MMIIHKLLTGLLVLTFTALVALFTYKTFVNPEIVKADIKSTVIPQDKQQDKQKEKQVGPEKAAQAEETPPALAAQPAAQVMHNEELEGEGIEAKISEDFDTKVKDYILNHPEDIVKSLEGLQQKKIEESSKKSEHYLKDNKAVIENDGIAPIIGNYEGDVTIVVFYDYNCSYCKKGTEALEQVMETDNNIKVVLRPIPILGGTSLYLAKIALAIHKISPEKFQIIHHELMQLNRPIAEAAVKELIAKHDIDYAMVENEINSYSIRELINRNLDLAQNIDLKGAPSYVINGRFFPGLLDFNRLKNIIAEMRQPQH